MNILIFIFCLMFAVLAVRRFEWAVMFLIAALPSYLIRFKIFGLPFTLLEAMILIVFSAWFIKNYKWIINNLKQKLEIRNFPPEADPPLAEKLEIFRYPFDLEIILLLIISFIATGVAGFSNDAMGIWKAYFFEPALLYMVIFNILVNKNSADSIKEKERGEILNSKYQILNKLIYFKLKIDLKFKICNLNLILIPLLISALLVSFFAIYQKITGQFINNPMWAAEGTRRVVSFFGYPNAVGLYLGSLVLIFTGWAAKKYSDKKYLVMCYVLCVMCLSILSIYFARSEGALIGIAAGLILFGLLAGKKARWVTVGLAAVAIIGITAYQPAREYAVRKITLNDFSGQVRRMQWDETWKMLKDGRFIAGAGLANYQNAIKPYHQEGFFYNRDNDFDFHRKTVFNEEYRRAHWQPLEIYLYPHNIFLNFWTELGLAGTLLFIWIIGKFYYLGFRNWNLIRNSKLEIRNLETIKNNYLIIGLLSAMAVIIIHGLVDVLYFKNDLAMMFWIFIAMMAVIDLSRKNVKVSN